MKKHMDLHLTGGEQEEKTRVIEKEVSCPLLLLLLLLLILNSPSPPSTHFFTDHGSVSRYICGRREREKTILRYPFGLALACNSSERL